jgi:outer membrane immunogenic protein
LRCSAPRRWWASRLRPVYNWTGFYIGINGGGGWGTSSWSSTGSFGTSGGVVGGTVGYNYQINQIVLGAEGDVDWAGLSGNTVTSCPAGCTTKDTWLATARARVGYAADRFLPYVTGGAAFGDIRASMPGAPGASASNAGWTIGGGVEAAIAGNWTAKVEYLYVDLGNFNCGTSCGAAAVNDVSFRANLLRGGINYRF